MPEATRTYTLSYFETTYGNVIVPIGDSTEPVTIEASKPEYEEFLNYWVRTAQHRVRGGKLTDYLDNYPKSGYWTVLLLPVATRRADGDVQ